MTRKLSVISEDGPDPMDSAIEHHQRMLKLQQQRAKRIQAVSAAYEAAVTSLKARALAHHEEMLRNREQSRAKRIIKIMQNHKRRQEIESKMMKRVLMMHAAFSIVDDAIISGYRGREIDAKSSTEAHAGAPRGEGSDEL